MSLERDLRRALQREPAPADFKRRLMARIPGEPGPTPVSQKPVWWKRRLSLALATALIAGAAIPVAFIEARRERRERGIEARNELLTALSKTNSTLRHTRELIRRGARRSG